MSDDIHQPIQRLARRNLLRLNRFLQIDVQRVVFPNGVEIEDWSLVVTPDYVNVVLLTDDDKFVFFRQRKVAYEGLSLAPIGGYIEQGEDPLAAAKRETLEETGYQAQHWQSCGTYVVDANRGAGTAHLFLATGAQQVTAPNADDLEVQEMILLTRDEVAAALHDNQFKVLAWASVVALALLKLDAIN